MIRWFGKSWGAPMCAECEHVDVPVGETCNWCEEPIAEGEQGIFYSNGPASHLFCFLRQTTGSLAHVTMTCSCYVKGASETDPPEMTKREAAKAAVQMWELLRDLKTLSERGLL